MFRLMIAIFMTGTLSGCATAPQWLASYYDQQDPCQVKHRPAGYERPSWCGAGNSRTKLVVRDNNGRIQGTIRDK